MCLGVPGASSASTSDVADVDFWGVAPGAARAGERAGRAGRLHPEPRRLRHSAHPADDIAATLALYEELLMDEAPS